MTYQTTHPDFVLDVELPQGFKDISYVNDSCPSWRDDEHKLDLFIDYANASLREHPENKRFYLARQDYDTDIAPAEILLTDDWQEMVAKINELRK